MSDNDTCLFGTAQEWHMVLASKTCQTYTLHYIKTFANMCVMLNPLAHSLIDPTTQGHGWFVKYT